MQTATQLRLTCFNQLKTCWCLFLCWHEFREFKEANKVDRVVVLWTANTERYSNLVVGLNDTMENLFAAVDRNESEISPSTLFAIACVMENVPFINGSPQNTFVPGSFDACLYSPPKSITWLYLFIVVNFACVLIRADWSCHQEEHFNWWRWLQEWSNQNEICVGGFPCGSWYQGTFLLH